MEYTQETITVEDIDILDIKDLKANFLDLMNEVVKQYEDDKEEAADAQQASQQ
jgi:hypothetical protein